MAAGGTIDTICLPIIPEPLFFSEGMGNGTKVPLLHFGIVFATIVQLVLALRLAILYLS